MINFGKKVRLILLFRKILVIITAKWDRESKMKSVIKSVMVILVLFVFGASKTKAQMPYMEEVKALGAVSGQGLACGASKFETFELLARAILLTKSPTDKLQNDAIYAYSEAKANAYMSKEMDGFYGCETINRRFDNQEIFKAVLYADGSIKMPDGKLLTPRRPYDARMIYKKNAKVRENAQAIYNGSGEAKILEVNVKDSTLEQAQIDKTQRNLNVPEYQNQAPEPKKIDKTYVPDYQDSGIKHISRSK